jgi:hypothetical protein
MYKQIFLALAILSLCGISNAALIDRGGGLIYDSTLNITWLQDANYAKTSGYNSDGLMTWSQSVTWADGLSYGGYSDWRLPKMLPVNPPNYNYSWSYDGSTDFGFNMTSPNSELAYMYYVNLGNLAYYDTSGNGPQVNWGLKNSGPLFNLEPGTYWYGTDRPGSDWRFHFHFSNGNQDDVDARSATYYAWAVRDGDVAAVPIPNAALLLGSGLVMVWGRIVWDLRRRIKSNLVHTPPPI